MFAATGTRFYPVTDVYRRYQNFAPFVRQIGERKAQTCAKAMFQQLRSVSSHTPATVPHDLFMR